jgi:hypothetical protein
MSKIDTTLQADASIALRAPTTETPAKQAANKTETLILAVTLFGIVLWGLSVAAFGIPGLYIPALIAVPVIWTLLILITRG